MSAASSSEAASTSSAVDVTDAASATPDPTAYLNRRVLIHGLKAKPELNGTHGRVIKYLAEKERFQVSLESGAPPILLKVANLEYAEEASTTDQFVVNTDRIIVKRSADPDGSVYSQVSMQPGINDFIAREQMECWCESLGSFADSQTAFVVVAFALSQLRELPQPTTEEELQDHTRERGTLESDPIRLFGLRLCVTAAPAMGQVSFGLREVAVDPAPPLDATRGTAMLTSCFVLKSADNLMLPPPMSNGVHANQVRGNSTMKVWCGVGEVVSTICCSDINALPTVKPAILAAPPFGPPKRAPPAAVMAEELTSLPGTSGGVVAIGLFLEQCGTTSTRDEFEAMSIQAVLHVAHEKQTPKAAVPPFCKWVVDEDKSVGIVQERAGGEAISVYWMETGRGM